MLVAFQLSQPLLDLLIFQGVIRCGVEIAFEAADLLGGILFPGGYIGQAEISHIGLLGH